MATDEKPSFLKLLPGLRDRIYKMLFCYPGIVGHLGPKKLLPSHPSNTPCTIGKKDLSGQFLRTCKAIHSEGVPILYGKNTFNICITLNGEEPVQSFRVAAGLLGLFSRCRRRANITGATYQRKFCIQIRSCNMQGMIPLDYSSMRTCLRRVVAKLEAVTTIDSLVVKHSVLDPINNLWVDPCPLDNAARSRLYPHWNPDQRFYAMIRTWLSQLRVSNDVVIIGLPQETADILTERLKSKELPIRSLEARYAALESHVDPTSTTMELDLNLAIQAVEEGCEEEFNYYRTKIFQDTLRRLEGMMGENILWDTDINTDLLQTKGVS